LIIYLLVIIICNRVKINYTVTNNMPISLPKEVWFELFSYLSAKNVVLVGWCSSFLRKLSILYFASFEEVSFIIPTTITTQHDYIMQILFCTCCKRCKESMHDEVDNWKGFCSECLINMFICDECFNVHNNQDDLYEDEACADDCCYKLICSEGCNFICDKCRNSFKHPNEVKKKTSTRLFLCNLCIDKMDNVPELESAEIWYGLSREEHEQRYGY